MKTDLAIIGAGPGGYVAALRAAQLGMQVTVIEAAHLGGVCLNRGCIPTKAMLETAAVAHTVEQARKFGVLTEGPAQINYTAALARRDAVVSRLRNGVRGLLTRGNVQLMAGRASFLDSQSIRVEPAASDVGAGKSALLEDACTLEAEHFLIATGSRPLPLGVPGADGHRVLDSDGALALPAVPASVVIVGAGAVGCEWSQIFTRLGAKVTLVEMVPHILPGQEPELSAELAKVLEKEGVTVLTGTSVTAIKHQGEAVEVALAPADAADSAGPATGGAQSVTGEYVLVAAGRSPLTQGLSLEAAGVAVDGNGWIITDEFQRTNVPSILAIGDVTGQALLAHVASRQGVVAVEKLAGLSPEPVRLERIPFVTYTDPEVAAVGLTEAQAREGGAEVQVGRFPLAANGRAVAQGAEAGLVKVVAEAKYGTILGVHLVGPHAGEMLGEAVLELQVECTLDELVAVLRPHPSLSEAIGEAALAAQGRALHV